MAGRRDRSTDGAPGTLTLTTARAARLAGRLSPATLTALATLLAGKDPADAATLEPETAWQLCSALAELDVLKQARCVTADES